MKPLLACIALALPLAASAQPSTPLSQRSRAEIDHLLAYIGASGCQFSRNGSWHDWTTARDHVATKLDYLSDRGMIDSAETFIDKAASRSSLSGSDYLVQCPGAAAVASGSWLRSELARFRGERG